MQDERHFRTELLDPQKFIKVNDLKEITSSIPFVRDGVPSSDGLLSNEIFGISKDERANIFAYIDLTEWFLQPLAYKIWSRMDKRIIEIVHGTNKFIINSKGDFEESENGKNGVKFLKENMDKIKFKSTGSHKRDVNIRWLEENKDKLFIKQYIVIPAYYRDVASNGGRVGIGEINKLYTSLLIAVKALRESAEYGLSMSGATRGRIQETILQIYNWFADEPKLSKKNGIIRRAQMSKTTDYSARLVLSAPNLREEKADDLMVDTDHTAIPLSAVCTNLFPYIIFWVRRFFENEFSGSALYPFRDKKTGEIKYTEVKDPMIEFSDERIKKELNRFLHGFSNRFIPIHIPNKDGKNLYMFFKGKNKPIDEITGPEDGVVRRRLTWCDLFYMAAVECSKDKHCLLTRFPIDSYYNIFGSKIVVSSTKKTEAIYYDNTFYKNYPYIREEDIEQDTSNKFVDTLRMGNEKLGSIGGDYDGDQVTCRIAYSIEANEEIDKYLNSKAYYINLGGRNIKTSSNEAIQSLYNLTQVLSDTKLTEPQFK